MMLYARLAKRLRGDLTHRSIAKMIKRNIGHLLPFTQNMNIFQRKIKATQGSEDILR
jgi:hypothetical protein